MGATNLIPGPNSTQMTMHLGKERAGNMGLIVGGLAFILPAIFITGVFAWLYAEYSHLPKFELFVYGIKPAVLVLITSAVIKLGKKSLKSIELSVLAVIVLIAALLGLNEITALLGAGILGILYFYMKNGNSSNATFSVAPLFLTSVISVPSLAISTANVFWIFLKIGLVLYGGGYVLFAYLDAEFAINGCHSRRSIHARTHSFYSYFYWIPINRILGCGSCLCWVIFTFIHFGNDFKSIGS